MARFGLRANGLPIFGPGQAEPIYKLQIRAKTGPGHGPTQAYSSSKIRHFSKNFTVMTPVFYSLPYYEGSRSYCEAELWGWEEQWLL